MMCMSRPFKKALFLVLGSCAVFSFPGIPCAGNEAASNQDHADSFVASDDKTQSHYEYPNKAAGDTAYQAGDYAVAGSFYTKYRESAGKNHDRESMRDASEREIDTFIMGGLHHAAGKALAAFEQDFPGINPLSVSMWKADILLLRRSPKEARVILERILPGFTAQDSRRMRALSSLAFAYELSGEYKKAAQVYQTICQGIQSESTFRRMAQERVVLNLAASGDTDGALKELLSFAPSQAERDKEALRLLNRLLQMKTLNIKEIPENFLADTKLPESLRNDSFFYVICSLIGDLAFQAKRYHLAEAAYRLAFDSSLTAEDSYESVRRLITVFSAAGETPEAVDLALRQHDLFRGSFAGFESKMAVARLLAANAQVLPALDIYRSLYTSSSAEEPVRFQAMKEALDVLVTNKDLPAARLLLTEYFKSSKLPVSERDLLSAELLVREGKFAEAVSAYLEVGKQYPQEKLRASFLAALVELENKRYQEVIALSSQILSSPEILSKPKELSEFLYLRANAYRQSGNHEKALQDYERFLPLEKVAYPGHVRVAVYEIARLYSESGRDAAANPYYRRFVEEFPDHELHPKAYYCLIDSLYKQGKETEAEKASWRFLEQYPQAILALTAMSNMAIRFAEKGMTDKAFSALDPLIKRTDAPEIQSKAIYEKALYYFRAGEIKKAEEQLSDFETRFPNRSSLADVYYLQGDIAKVKGDFKQAEIAYRKVRERRPDSSLELAALGSTGDLYFASAAISDNQEDYKLALTAYQELLERPNAPSSLKAMALYKKGRVQILLDREEEARGTYRTLIHFLPASKAASKPEERLWTVKSVEGLVDLAMRRPTLRNIEAAREGLQWLSDAGILSKEVAMARMNNLKPLRTKRKAKTKQGTELD